MTLLRICSSLGQRCLIILFYSFFCGYNVTWSVDALKLNQVFRYLCEEHQEGDLLLCPLLSRSYSILIASLSSSAHCQNPIWTGNVSYIRDLSHNRECLTYVLYNIWQIVILALAEKSEPSLFVRLYFNHYCFWIPGHTTAWRKEGLSVDLIKFTPIYQSKQYIRQ